MDNNRTVTLNLAQWAQIGGALLITGSDNDRALLREIERQTLADGVRKNADAILKERAAALGA